MGVAVLVLLNSCCKETLGRENTKSISTFDHNLNLCLENGNLTF